jgi:D-glycero-alpha-D-manno-heptose-7-phosphate kinase
MKASTYHSVTTMTPLRVSFLGGGTDFPDFHKSAEGLVVSMAIQQFIYVTVKRHSPLFGEKYRISYSETEHVNRLEDIQNEIVRSCIELVGIDEPLYVATSSDLPAQSGLGSSSSFAVGLLNALHLMIGKPVSAGQLAEEACEVEISRMGKPIGKQDQYAAAFGGLNAFRFHTDGRVSIDPITLDRQTLAVFDDLVLLWTGMQRKAESILLEQNERTRENAVALLELVELSHEFKSQLLDGGMTLQRLADLLTQSWQIKRGLASSVTSPELDGVYEMCISAGALGGKLLGAGGGGFLLMGVPAERKVAFLREVRALVSVSIALESQGSRALSTVSV